MPTYRVITQLYYGSDQLSFNNCYIDAISPSQAMRKHKLPKLKPNQEIIINILPVDKGGASPSSSIDEYYETINNKSPSDFVDLSPKLKPITHPTNDEFLAQSNKRIKQHKNLHKS